MQVNPNVSTQPHGTPSRPLSAWITHVSLSSELDHSSTLPSATWTLSICSQSWISHPLFSLLGYRSQSDAPLWMCPISRSMHTSARSPQGTPSRPLSAGLSHVSTSAGYSMSPRTIHCLQSWITHPLCLLAVGHSPYATRVGFPILSPPCLGTIPKVMHHFG